MGGQGSGRLPGSEGIFKRLNPAPFVPVGDSTQLPNYSVVTGAEKLTGNFNAVNTNTLKVVTGAAADKVLTSDASGNATWQAAAGGSPGGANTQVQFNDSSAFGGDAGFTYNKTTDSATLVGGLTAASVAGGAISGTSLTIPGAGASSEKYGSGATAVGTNTVSIGNNATAAGAYATTVGQAAAAAGSTGAAFGFTSSSSGARSTAIGAYSLASNDDATALGYGSTASGASSSALGKASSATATNALAIGFTSSATATTATAIGSNAISAYSSSIAMGYDTATTAANQFVAGSSGAGGTTNIANVYFGSGVTSTVPVDYSLNGTGGSGTDIAGGAVNISGGKGTGTGAGGDVKVNIALAGSTGTALNALSTVATVKGTTGYMGVGAAAPDARFEVETTTTDGQQALTIDQNDADQAFIDYQGTSSADATNNISTLTVATIAGYVKVEINGTAYWMPYYNAPTA